MSGLGDIRFPRGRISATFHDNAIDASVLDRALKLVSADPLALLSEPT